MQIRENEPLAPFTTFDIGGPARWMAEAASEEEVAEAAAWAGENRVPLLVLGGGSNLLIADRGFDGLVLRVALKGIMSEDIGPHRIYRASAGEDWCALVDRAVGEECAGIECLAGIPGTVGGTPAQNVGAYGQEVSESVDRVRAYDLNQKKFVEFSAAECGFFYRRSRFNSVERGRYVVTRVDYRLTPGGHAAIRYRDLADQMGPDADRGPAAVADAVKAVRRRKGMLLIPGDPDCQSAGSFFKNPVVKADLARQIALAARSEPPTYPADEGRVKLPAAWLIERAGFAKGYRRGAAAISSKHTLALINRGGASAAEVLALAKEIAATVEARFGVRLEMEPVMAGF